MTTSPRWPAVVFDLDGTLVDTVPLIVASYQHTFRTHFGREEDEVRIRAWIGQPLIRAFREVDPARADELMATYLEWNDAHTEEFIRPFDGAAELLRDLSSAGVHVGVATSKRRGQAERAVTLTGLADLIDLTVTVEDTDRHKPEPEPIALACRRLGVEPMRAVYVGDATVDLLAGRAAGADTVAVLWGAGTREALDEARPTARAETVDELRRLMLPAG